jgi:cation transport regulator ChaB
MLQAILFDKEKWTKSEAEKWTKENAELTKAALSENIESAPYHRIDELPDSIRKLSPKLQKMWMSTWNSVYDQYKDEAKAFRIAWSQVNKHRSKAELGD